MVYDLVPTAGYFIGVNPEMNRLALASKRLRRQSDYRKTRVPYVYENSPENLEEISRIINEFYRKPSCFKRRNTSSLRERG